MSKTAFVNNHTDHKAYIITGPTSGIGRCTALELAKHGTVVLVGRDRGRLDEVQKTIEQKGQHAVSVECDLSARLVANQDRNDISCKCREVDRCS
jgi:short-subunit dehydrogenase